MMRRLRPNVSQASVFALAVWLAPIVTPVVLGVPSPSPGPVEAVCRSAVDLVTANKPNEALDLLDKAAAVDKSTAPNACILQTRYLALQKLGELRNSPSPPEPQPVLDQKGWDNYVASYVVPWGSRVLTWAGALAGLLILARLFAFLPQDWFPRHKTWQVRSKKLRLAYLTVGIFMMILASAMLVSITVINQPPSVIELRGRQVFPIILGALGAYCFAVWIATRPRMSISVRDKTGKVNEALATYMVSLLGELGPTPANRVHMPQASDLTGLSDVALSTELPNVVLATLQKTVQIILGNTPWIVAIDAASDHTLSIAMTRNGWNTGAVVIDSNNALIAPLARRSEKILRPAAGEPVTNDAPMKPPPELYKMAAAFLVTELSKHYEGYEGLCGATNWQSIGLHFIATTDATLEEPVQISTLAKAARIDPANQLASVELMRQRFSRRHREYELQIYWDWVLPRIREIEDLRSLDARRFEGYRGLLYGLRYNALSVGPNLIAAKRPRGRLEIESSHEEEMKIRNVLGEMAGYLITDLLHSHPATLNLERRIELEVALLAESFKIPDGEKFEKARKRQEILAKEAMGSTSPWILYQQACILMRKKSPGQKGNFSPKIEELLRMTADVDDSLRDWIPKDPEFNAYFKGRKWKAFKQKMAKAADDKRPSLKARLSNFFPRGR